MTSPTRWRLDRQISVAVLVAVALQAAAALMWAGRASARIDDLRQRLDAQAPVAERLARLEAQADATRASLARIESKLDGDRRD
jgi:type VI protein secretion system component VasK